MPATRRTVLTTPPLYLTVLVDLDSLSRGLAEGSASSRASDQDLAAAMRLIRNSADRLGHVRRVRYASSSETAVVHQDVLFRTSSNVWAIRRGLNGADGVLLDEMRDLAAGRVRASSHPAHRHALVLCGQDFIYAPAVR